MEEDLISCLCLRVKSRALVLNAMAENLDAFNVWWLGVFIAPPTKMVVGEAVCRRAHRTVQCATGHCLVRQPRHPTVRVRPLELLTAGPPDSPVVHRTGAVHCPVRFLAPALTLRAQSALFTVHFAVDRWRCSRCFRWHTGQSGDLPDSLVNYSGVTLQKPEAEQFRVDLPGAPDTVRWHTGQFGAPDQGTLRLVLLLYF
jgi:hypothetical protein